MSNKINKLSELTANQIAAGEVVQRPSSVIKELMENSIDAGTTVVMVGIKDGGRSSIQVIDDGCGMSFDDAITAFERHATSKIKQSDDLFKLATFGFRGEALPSIASVSEVELRTMQPDDELGTSVMLSGGEVTSHSKINTTVGTHFIIKNLFYNVPARRKFMRSAEVETRNIIEEFKKIALSYPQVTFILHNNDKCVYNLPMSNLRSRICDVVGDKINKNLIELYVDTPLVEIKGYIGRPDKARKSSEQYMYINGRYFKSSYFNKTIISAYENLLPSGEAAPQYFLYIKCSPAEVDVNIHPSKIEVKFENEAAIAHILKTAVRSSLGKNGIMPMIDFDCSSGFDIPVVGDRGVIMKENNTSRVYDANDENFSFTTALFGKEEKSIDIEDEEGDDFSYYSALDVNSAETKTKGREVLKSAFEKEPDDLSLNTIISSSAFGDEIDNNSDNLINATSNSLFGDLSDNLSDNISSNLSSNISDNLSDNISSNLSSSISDNIIVSNIDFGDDQNIIESFDDFININQTPLNLAFDDGVDGVDNVYSIDREPPHSENSEPVDLFAASSCAIPIGEVTLLGTKHIVTTIGDDIFIIDTKRAMSRIMYDRYSGNVPAQSSPVSQKLIFSTTISLQASDKMLLDSCKEDLFNMGFTIQDSEQPNSIDVLGVPVDMSDADPNQLFEDLLDSLRADDNFGYNMEKREKLILTLSSIATNKKYSNTAKEDMRFIVETLRKCDNFSYSPAGKPIIAKIGLTQIKKILE